MLWNMERNIMQQGSMPLAIVFQVQAINANTIALTCLHKLMARKGKLVRTYTDLISRPQYLAAYSIRVDIGMISTVQIDDTISTALYLFQTCMITGNLWIFQNYHIIWVTPNGNNRSVQPDRRNFRYNIQFFRCLPLLRSSIARRKLP